LRTFRTFTSDERSGLVSSDTAPALRTFRTFTSDERKKREDSLNELMARIRKDYEQLARFKNWLEELRQKRNNLIEESHADPMKATLEHAVIGQQIVAGGEVLSILTHDLEELQNQARRMRDIITESTKSQK
jgi:hypothetical protein